MRADPQRAPGARQSPNRIVRQAVLGCEYSLDTALEPVQPVVGANPHSPGGVLEQDVHVGFPATREHRSAPAPLDPRDASVAADPQHAPRIQQQRTDTGVDQSWAFNLLEAAIAVMQQCTVPRAHPQRSIWRRLQSDCRVPLKKRCIRFVEYREIHAIEESQSVGGRKPEVPVGGLRDGADGVVGQPVRGCPNVMAALCESQPGIPAPGGDRQQGHRQQADRTKGHNLNIGCTSPTFEAFDGFLSMLSVKYAVWSLARAAERRL